MTFKRYRYLGKRIQIHIIARYFVCMFGGGKCLGGWKVFMTSTVCGLLGVFGYV